MSEPRLLRAQRAECQHASLDGLHPLRKAETQVASPFAWVVKEARSRHCCHSDLLDQVTRHRGVVAEAKAADPGHHVISAIGRRSVEDTLLQARDDGIAPFAVIAEQLEIEVGWQL